ncbi:hypothetical protein X797_009327 [Metarhizium robertsii]|uniref:Uncharacterized protein n=2 Tax=Metarhizium robertsii TaxID=568076 RepID=E9EK61_METRA|nr:uncharacterized protein MAA_00475 [Metarhizium robertsii ARSEF 23]EFZ03401.1 hypothetical protein MAA_00475 [Metarhizium robertsii ARSEF 23]EXU97607.1 hypothetical protein X797_009327 [Metarhizium robertsii]
MLVNTVALAGVLALLDCASASALKKRQVLKDENVAARLAGGAKVGDQCHPPGTYSLGGEKAIPPCLSEQAIALKCEIVTQVKKNTTSEANWKAYGSCLRDQSSSYFQDVNGCLACKAAHNHMSQQQFEWYTQAWAQGQKAFLNDTVPKATAWEYVQGAINGTTCQQNGTNATISGWACWNQLPAGTGIATKNLTIDEYYKDRPKTQNIGSFEFGGKSFPESSSVELGLLVPTFEIKADVGYFSSVKLENGKITSELNATAKVEILTQYQEITSIFNFTKPDEFTVLPVINAPVPVKDSVATVPKAEAADLPAVKCDAKCRDGAPTIDKIQEVAAQGPKEADKAVVEACKPALRDLEENKPLSVTHKVQIITEIQIKTEINAPVNFKGQAPPQQNGPGPSDPKGIEPPSQKGPETPKEKGSGPSDPKGSETPSQKGPEPPKQTGSAPAGQKGPETSTEDDKCEDDSEAPAAPPVGGADKGASKEKLKETPKETANATCEQGDPAKASVKVTICQMPGEKDCKTYYQ